MQRMAPMVCIVTPLRLAPAAAPPSCACLPLLAAPASHLAAAPRRLVSAARRPLWSPVALSPFALVGRVPPCCRGLAGSGVGVCAAPPWPAWARRPFLCPCFAVLRCCRFPFGVYAGGLFRPCLLCIVLYVVVAFFCSGWFVPFAAFAVFCVGLCCWVGYVPCVCLSVSCFLSSHFLRFPFASLCNTVSPIATTHKRVC
jgi:hypothetical protein